LHSDSFEDESDWELRSVPVAFRIGEVPAFRIPLSLLVPTRHFLDVEPILTPDALPSVARRSRAAGLLLRSHPVQERLPLLRFRRGWIRYCPAQYTRYLVQLDRSLDAYMAGFSAQTRSTLLRKVRRFLQAAGPDPFREYRTPEEMDEFFPLARALSAKTFQERLLNSGLPAGDEFRSQLRALAARGQVRAYLLFMGTDPVAYLCCPAMGESGILLYQYLGYDPDHGSLSPGTVLQYFALRRLFEEGTWKLFDFLEGETQEKRQFSTMRVPCADLYYLRPTLRNAAIVLLRFITESSSDAAGSLLDRVGLKKAVKRWMRRSAPGKAAPGGATRGAGPTSGEGEQG